MKSKRACALLGLAAVVLSVPTAFATESPTTDTVQEAADLRVMTWNIQHGVPNGGDPDGPANLGRTAAVIRAENPDVVTLNEVHDDEAGSGSHGHQPALLKDLLAGDGYAYSYYGVSETHGPGHPGTRGEMILSKYPLSDPEVTKLSTQNSHPGELDRRALVKVNVDVPGAGTVRVYATHLSPPASDAQILDQQDQAREIVDTISNVTEPVVLAGDFNVRPDNVVKTWLANDGLIDSWTIQNKSSDGVTRPNSYGNPDDDHPDRRIDYVFSSPRFDVLDSHVSLVDRDASDHLAVVANLRMRAPTTLTENSVLAGEIGGAGWAQLATDDDSRAKLTVCKIRGTDVDDGWVVQARLYRAGESQPYRVSGDGGTSRDKCQTSVWTGDLPAALEVCVVKGEEERACRRESV